MSGFHVLVLTLCFHRPMKQESVHNDHQCGLAGAIWSHEGDDLALVAPGAKHPLILDFFLSSSQIQ